MYGIWLHLFFKLVDSFDSSDISNSQSAIFVGITKLACAYFCSRVSTTKVMNYIIGVVLD